MITTDEHTERPMAPASLRVNHLSTNSACIEWTAPQDDGGSPVRAYILEKRLAGQRTWERLTLLPPDIRECELENMDSTRDYFVRIRAENKHGPGQPREISGAIRVKGVQKGKQLTTTVHYAAT